MAILGFSINLATVVFDLNDMRYPEMGCVSSGWHVCSVMSVERVSRERRVSSGCVCLARGSRVRLAGFDL